MVKLSKGVVVVSVLRVVLIVLEAVTSVVVVSELDRAVSIGFPVVEIDLIVVPALRDNELLEGSTTAVVALVTGIVDTCVVCV